jgi:hypothetical protein
VVNTFVAEAGRRLSGERAANAVLLRGLSARPSLAGYRERFRLKAAAIAAYPMYRGVAQLAGMQVFPSGEKVSDAFAEAKARWAEFDFFFIHVKGTDMAGEDGNFDAKVATIEEVDRALPGLLAQSPDVLCVTGDHSTPVPARGHSWHPVPVLVHGRWCGADGAARFHESSCRTGSLGVLASRDLMAVLLANAGRLDKLSRTRCDLRFDGSRPSRVHCSSSPQRDRPRRTLRPWPVRCSAFPVRPATPPRRSRPAWRCRIAGWGTIRSTIPPRAWASPPRLRARCCT